MPATRDQVADGSREDSDIRADAMFESTLSRTPAQRLADAARIARFVLRGREALRAARDGNG